MLVDKAKRYVTKRRVIGAIAAFGVLVVSWILPSIIVNIYSRPYRVNTPLPHHYKYAIVFGAGVQRDNQPTHYLQTRLDKAVELYRNGVVDHFLLSGDNGVTHYNEPVVMGRYLQAKGVPSSAITLDYAGFSTYDTCYRAKVIFGVTNDVVLVSHGYHLPRAIQTCRALGVWADG